MLLRSLVRLSVLALCLFAEPGSLERVQFLPAEGSTLTKRFQQNWEMVLEDVRVFVDGEDWSRWVAPGNLHTQLRQTVVVSDTYGKTEDGRPLSLDREYRQLSQELVATSRSGGFVGFGEALRDVSGSSDLEGTSVHFRWEDGAYERAFQRVDAGSDSRLLQGLSEDMDLRALLPEGPVEAGDEWELELSHIPDLLTPGGSLSWNLEQGGRTVLLGTALDPALMADVRQLLDAALRGTATVTCTRIEDGLAELEYELRVGLDQDLAELTDLANELLRGRSTLWSPLVERLELRMSLKARGTAWWDLEAGRLHGLELSGSMTSDLILVLALWSGSWIEIRSDIRGRRYGTAFSSATPSSSRCDSGAAGGRRDEPLSTRRG